MSDSPLDRRTLLKSAIAGLVALPCAGLVREAQAQGTPHLDEKDPLAVAMGYVHDAKKVDARIRVMRKSYQSSFTAAITSPFIAWRPLATAMTAPATISALLRSASKPNGT